MHPPIYALILDIRAAFRALRVFSDQMNEGRGITAARRAVIEHLADVGGATVPQIAEAKSVTRQNIQIIADELVAQSLAEWAENPAHKRSRRLRLSENGSAVFAEIRAEEARVLARLEREIDPDVVASGRRALVQLIAALTQVSTKKSDGSSDR